MQDKNKSKKELLKELIKLRQGIAEIEQSEIMRKKEEEELSEYRENLEKLVKQRTSQLTKMNKQLKLELEERKKAEQAMQESIKMYKTLAETSFDAVAVHKLNADVEVLDISSQMLELLGLESTDDIIGESGYVVIAPEDQKKARIVHQKILDQGFVRNVELNFLKKDGTHFVGEINATLVKDANGKPKRLVGATRDITERKEMEEKLKQYSKQLEQRVKERTSELRVAQKEVESLRKQIKQSKSYPEILGNSPKMLQVIDLVHQVASTNSTVLIYGETGSGKDLIARAIHFNSHRKNGAFVIVNCAALPEHLIESELFGYVKGAFTGATRDKKGFFGVAHKGTIFLNEIGEMPLEFQAKLLQVLESQQINPLGQSISITIDVRIISASNIDLEEAVNKGRFRKDLFYRLNILPIKVPPLRERKEDIPLLAKHFLDKYCASMGKQITNISREAMNMLCNYTYPGNVRELENIIQQSLIMAPGSTILPQHLPEKMRAIKSAIKPHRLAKVDKEEIEEIINRCGGNLTKAAKKLGVHRITLWRKLKKLGI